MEISVLAHHLHMLVADVNESEDGLIDLRRVDWEAIAERLVEKFDQAA
jgi:hypothetical protein